MKIPVETMKLILRPGVQILHTIFSRHNYEIRVAGGAVRDLLMNKIPGDLDFATTATPPEMKTMFNEEGVRLINLGGEKHGTITARIEEENFECTTLRIDKVTDGRHAEVEFIRDWEQDAGRRDLTINAMFLGLDGTIYDFFNGIQHLKERKVLFVGDPDKRIKEDYLRILRYFRFFGRVAEQPDVHDPEIISAFERNCEGLAKISGERIWVELKKILTGKYSSELLMKIVECGIGTQIGLTTEFDCENLRKVYANLKDKDYHYCTLLASGMKEEEALVFINRVKCSNKEKDLLLFIIKHRNSFNKIQSVKDTRDILVDFVYKEKKNVDLALELTKQLLLYVGRGDLLHDVNESLIPRFPIKGGLLVDKVQKRNQIQKELRRLLDLWKESDYSLTREELLNKV